MTGRLFLSLLLLLGGTRLSADSTPEGFFDLAVPGGAATLDALGIRPAERGIALYLFARQFDEGGRAPAPAPLTGTNGGRLAPDAAVVAAPISEDAWREALGMRPTDDLFNRLLTDRGARLVAAGATATTAGIRALLDADRALLRVLCLTTPGAFAVVAPALALREGRIDVPGGAEAEPVWAALAEASPEQPGAFIRALTSRDDGRLAWFYSTLGDIEPARLHALLPPGTPGERIERARSLYEVFREIDGQWRVEERPFMRSAADPWSVLTGTALDGDRVAAPAWRWLWTALFDREDLAPRDATGVSRSDGTVDLSWLVHEIGRAGASERRDEFEMLRFAQRVFADASEADATDVLIALGGFRRYRALVLALERMGLSEPSVYRAAIEAARLVDDRGARQRGPAVITFQSALAMVGRMRQSRAIDQPAAGRLVLGLAERIAGQPAVPQAVVAWITETLIPELPPLVRPDAWTGRTAHESVILQALAGRPPTEPPATIEWEGLEYRIDVFGAELERLHRIRERLRSPGLDAAMASGRPDALATALLTLAYVPALGDPDGPALLGPDVPARHDFNFSSPSSMRRERVPWLPPRDLAGDGRPWRVQGALMGLDLGLATVALRRVADGQMPQAPTINLNDQLTLARTVVSLSPADLDDGDRDEIVASIARGRRRVSAARADPVALDALAVEAGMSPATRESLPWMTAHLPESVSALFALRDLMWLGRPAVEPARLARWGVFAGPLDGRWTLAMPPPAPWEDFAGRPEIGQIGTQMPDLTLRIAEGTAALGLPACLVPALLTFATQDFWHDVDARFADDWPAMAAQAAALPLTRIEDYVAALAGTGPLR